MAKKKAFSFTKGYSFSFKDEGKEIEAWFSAISGLEKVFVDGELISSQRTLSTNTSNVFNIGQNEYSTDMNVVSMLRGPFVCTLSKNGKALMRQKLVVNHATKSNKPSFFTGLLFYIVLGALLGFSMSYWKLTDKPVNILLLVFCFALFFCIMRVSKSFVPTIEDEDIV